MIIYESNCDCVLQINNYYRIKLRNTLGQKLEAEFFENVHQLLAFQLKEICKFQGYKYIRIFETTKKSKSLNEFKYEDQNKTIFNINFI
jgi:hypothetical protein